MTFFRKYMVLIVGGAIALVLVIAALVLLLKFNSVYSRVQSDLQSSHMTLDRLHQRVPFPSIENVEAIRADLAGLEEYLDAVLSALSQEQILAEDMERAAFPSELDRTSRRLRALAVEHQVRVPEVEAFGFQRYAAGNLPIQEHVPRLVVQLRTVEAMCSLIFRQGISELISVEREVFDVERMQAVPEASPIRRPGRQADVVAAPPSSVEPRGVAGLYTKERYTITFLATDLALRDVLNRMADSPILMMVRNLEMHNEMALGGVTAASRLAERLRARDTARPAAPGAPREGATSARPVHPDDRVVAGRERVRVVMDVEVYRFEYEVVEGVEAP